MTDKPYYLTQQLVIPDLTENQELEMTLVHRYMERNGWDFPFGNKDCEEYDMAVSDVKWFLFELEELSKEYIKAGPHRSRGLLTPEEVAIDFTDDEGDPTDKVTLTKGELYALLLAQRDKGKQVTPN